MFRPIHKIPEPDAKLWLALSAEGTLFGKEMSKSGVHPVRVMLTRTANPED
jgi:hypothetical protein